LEKSTTSVGVCGGGSKASAVGIAMHPTMTPIRHANKILKSASILNRLFAGHTGAPSCCRAAWFFDAKDIIGTTAHTFPANFRALQNISHLLARIFLAPQSP
jgi:hypothetical protein